MIKKFISTTYKLYVGETAQEELMEETDPRQPLMFISGVGMMLPKFEEQLNDLNVGDKYDFRLLCADAYGAYEQDNIIDLPRSVFEKNGELDTEIVFKGNVVPLIDSEGNQLNAEVVEVGRDAITVDFNHPLAGEDLHFVGEILDIHEATDADIARFGMHQCGGCNCSGSDCGDCGCDSGCGCH